MKFNKVKITTTVPPENADDLRLALGKAGAGVIGNYTFCSFTVAGKGRFKPNGKAHPYIGHVGELDIVTEEQIEVTCDLASAKKVVAALRSAHPYEEPVVEIQPLLDEADLKD